MRWRFVNFPKLSLWILYLNLNCLHFSSRRYIGNSEVWSKSFHKLDESLIATGIGRCASLCLSRHQTGNKRCLAFNLQDDICNMGTYYHKYEEKSPQVETKISDLFSIDVPIPGTMKLIHIIWRQLKYFKSSCL